MRITTAALPLLQLPIGLGLELGDCPRCRNSTVERHLLSL